MYPESLPKLSYAIALNTTCGIGGFNVMVVLEASINVPEPSWYMNGNQVFSPSVEKSISTSSINPAVETPRAETV